MEFQVNPDRQAHVSLFAGLPLLFVTKEQFSTHTPLTTLYGLRQVDTTQLLLADDQVYGLRQAQVLLTAGEPLLLLASEQLSLQLTVKLFQEKGLKHLQVKPTWVLLSELATLLQFRTQEPVLLFQE